MSIIQGTSKGSGAGYEIDQSIRFNDDDAAYLYRDNNSAQTDTKKFTYSLWIKRGAITGGTNTGLLSGGSGTTSGRTDFLFTAGSATGDSSNHDALKFDIYTGGWTQRRATAKLRDPGGWYHIVLVYDAANSTANDTLIMYLNSTRLELDSTSGVPNNLSLVNANGQRTKVGADASGTPVEYDGLISDIMMIDGQALAPTAFAETNDDGVWIPKAYTGSYGTNGFYITGATASDLGEDFSGNNNDFTSTGLSTDQVTDTPTDNFCVLSPIDKNSNFTLSDGNLTNSNGTNAQAACFGTIAFDASDTDGFYWEVDCDSFASTGFAVLIADEAVNQTDISAAPTTQPAEGNLWAHRRYKDDSNGGITGVGATGSFADYGPPAVNGNVIGYCVKNGKLFIAINNTWLESSNPATEANPAFSNLSGNLRVGVNRFTDTGTDVTTLNFGQTGFTYTPPTGAKAISTASLATPSVTDPSLYFQPTLYEGNGSTQSINQTGNSTFQPDWVWIKNRDAADQHALFDVVRGATELMGTNVATAEATNDDTLTAFESDGFALGDDVIVNTNNESYVGWQWKANGSGSSNEDGSINTTATSANTTAGFSVSTYTGNATVGATVGHGLGIAPKVVIVKSRSGASAESWVFGHDSVGWTKAMYMQSTVAPYTLDIYWNNTAPTSSVVTLHDHAVTNGSSYTYVMYAFAEIPGYSSFGSYTGNGSTGIGGVFVHCGFTPAMVILKRTNSAQEWQIYDNQRSPTNVMSKLLKPNDSAAEVDNAPGDNEISFLSNGFQLNEDNGGMNASGSSYIFAAWAEVPFGGADIAPATAR